MMPSSELFKRLDQLDKIEKSHNSSRDKNGLSYQEWVRKKDAETRLKKKLLKELK